MSPVVMTVSWPRRHDAARAVFVCAGGECARRTSAPGEAVRCAFAEASLREVELLALHMRNTRTDRAHEGPDDPWWRGGSQPTPHHGLIVST